MLGILTVLLSSFFLAFHNVTVRVLFSEHLVLSLFLLGGYVKPDLQNSFLLMFMRMLLVVPLMASVSFKLYPSAPKEFISLFRRDRRDVMLQAFGCGVLMFVYITSLYIGIGLIPTGIALTLFFTYPVFTALLSWRFFGDRPTSFSWLIMGIILIGSVLTVPQSSAVSGGNTIAIGIGASIIAGIFNACYNVLAQKCLEKLHPVPFTWISFASTLLLSGVSLLFFAPPSHQLDWTPMWIGSIFSGLISFLGHSLNNVGIHKIGATTASIIGASSPAMTALIAWATISETLNVIQCVGIGVVTLGIALLSREKFLRKRSTSS
ncbi:DMT family transporter [Calothrix sp. FACHB-1219]|uniref:DMT family transporter n=1 Tax=unclassified Calothrix TaxID=2619626 RepID=UPI001683FEC2|nr:MULTISPECIES: DMT family transporter [unclassified Calothrix]MBD2207177.1 DMT family transporter [Calothrix sp. FACHB-168]MBD2221834.1 DMT family transporter [Calothrix sp. FACHB-1219]